MDIISILFLVFVGFPLILGCIPRLGVYSGQIPSMTGAGPTIDVGSDSVIAGAATANPGKPQDFVTGDFV